MCFDQRSFAELVCENACAYGCDDHRSSASSVAIKFSLSTVKEPLPIIAGENCVYALHSYHLLIVGGEDKAGTSIHLW